MILCTPSQGVCFIDGDDKLWAVIHKVALRKNFDKVTVGFFHDVGKVHIYYESCVNRLPQFPIHVNTFGGALPIGDRQ